MSYLKCPDLWMSLSTGREGNLYELPLQRHSTHKLLIKSHTGMKTCKKSPIVLASSSRSLLEDRTSDLKTSTPGVQRCVHMRLSLLRMMQYCINHVEWCNDLTFWVIFLSLNQFRLDHHGRTNGPTDGRTDKASYRDAWTHLKIPCWCCWILDVDSLGT